MDSFAEKIDRVDSTAARLDALLRTLTETQSVAGEFDTHLKRVVSDVLNKHYQR